VIEKAPKLKVFYSKAYGYAFSPKITKADIGIGSAGGKEIVININTS